MKIQVSDLRPNPFRRFEAYPLQPEKIAALKESIGSTEFWDNLVARRAPNGHGGFEIAFGHHRVQALHELGIETIDIPLRDLDDKTMLRMMAHENRAEWGAVAAVEQETVRAVVEAYASGTIELPKPGSQGGKTRNAPSFVFSHGSCEKPYTAETVQEFLGFKGDAGLNRIKDTLNALALIETGILSKEDVGDLTVYKVKLVQQVAKEYAHDPVVQQKVASGVAKKLRDGDIKGFDQSRATEAKLEASRIAHGHNVKSKSQMKAAKKPHTQDAEAEKLTAKLTELRLYNQALKRAAKLAEFAEFISASPRKKLLTALTNLRDDIDGLIKKINRSSK